MCQILGSRTLAPAVVVRIHPGQSFDPSCASISAQLIHYRPLERVIGRSLALLLALLLVPTIGDAQVVSGVPDTVTLAPDSSDLRGLGLRVPVPFIVPGAETPDALVARVRERDARDGEVLKATAFELGLCAARASPKVG